MARHEVRPGVKPFQVSAELRGRTPKHRKTEEKPNSEQKQEQPASAAA